MPDEANDDRKEANEPSGNVRVIHSKDLLQGKREVHILHEGQVYRLRLTLSNKLILST
jgi:hemin uptake protein HemP